MVRIKILITIAILSSNILSDASAYFYDGNQLIPMMREGERAERSENGADYLKASGFMGYVTGGADALGTSVFLIMSRLLNSGLS